VSHDASPDRVATRYLLLVGALFIVIGFVGGLLPGVGGMFVFFLPGGLLLLLVAAGVFLVERTVGEGLSRLLTQFYGASGASTPAPRAYSAIEALEARGAYTDAAEAYRSEIARTPADWEPRVRLAELLLRRLGDPAQAASLYREARDLVRDERRKVLLSLRLVEICHRHLGDRGRAVVELRRLIDTFPSSPRIAAARAELQRLLAETGP